MNRDVCEHFNPIGLCDQCRPQPIDTLAEFEPMAGRTRQWVSVGAWLYPGERIVHLGAGAPVGGPAGESSAAVVPAPARQAECPRCGKVSRPDDIHTCTPRRLTDDEIGQIWFQARIPGLTETAARLLIRAAEQWRTTR
jgi:hypothetical protein